MCRKMNGMRKRAVRIMYKSLFVAYVMYGSSEYMKSKYARKIMNRCQKIVLYEYVQLSEYVQDCFDGWNTSSNGYDGA